MSNPSLFVIVIASFNKECYNNMVAMRVAQLESRNIPYYFLINGDIPEDICLEKSKFTHYPNLSIKQHNNNSLVTPWATKAFQETLQTLYREKGLDAYDYILRLNVSTYVDFAKIPWMLQFLPKEGLVAGPLFVYNGKIFANGTAMLFSKDTAKAFAFETILDKDLCDTTNDDVVISWSLMDRYYLHDINMFYAWYEHFTEIPTVEDIHKKIKFETIFLRVKNDGSKRDIIDTSIWVYLYNMFH
jgi:hypothetical protein